MRYCFLILFFLFVQLSHAQKFEPGIEGGLNFTIANPSGVSGGYGDKKPFLGGFVGGSFRYKYSNKWFFKSALYFENRNQLSGNESLTDQSGQFIRYIENKRISNNYLNLKFENYFRLSKVISLGIGVNNHFLLWSTSYFPEQFVLDANNSQSPNKFSNHYYRTYWFSIPVTFNIDMNRWSLWFTYDKGVMSRLKGNSLFKERENCIQIGLGYRFVKKSK